MGVASHYTSEGVAEGVGGLHVAHPGVSRMKILARSYTWWPGLDADIEKIAKSFGTCQEHQRSPPKAPLHPWAQPERAW